MALFDCLTRVLNLWYDVSKLNFGELTYVWKEKRREGRKKH